MRIRQVDLSRRGNTSKDLTRHAIGGKEQIVVFPWEPNRCSSGSRRRSTSRQDTSTMNHTSSIVRIRQNRGQRRVINSVHGIDNLLGRCDPSIDINGHLTAVVIIDASQRETIVDESDLNSVLIRTKRRGNKEDVIFITPEGSTCKSTL